MTLLLLLLALSAEIPASALLPTQAADSLVVRSASGLQLRVVGDNADPKLRIILPGRNTGDRAIEVLFPEHVTARLRGSAVAEHLYVFRRRSTGERPVWRKAGAALEYSRQLPGGLHLLARATLDDDGVRFHYEFQNPSALAYDMISAVTDPRLSATFRDERLERTYVHHADGFDLLATETPARLTVPIGRWLPARYLASFTWPVPAQLVERRDDGVTYYTKSRAVDEPFIATVSTDRDWVVASFARDAGNVWTNPELTCQHVDPQRSLTPRGRAVAEVKLLVLRGSLEDALRHAQQQRRALQ